MDEDRGLPETFVLGFHDEEMVRKMPYKQLGNTGLQVSVMGFGGTDFGSVYFASDQSSCTAALHSALKQGVNYIDTAPLYGAGESERRIGQALKNIPRQAYYIGTKVGRNFFSGDNAFDFSYDSILKSVDASLNRLGLESVDLIQVHDFEFAESPDIIIKETLPALQKIKENGKARFIGINGYPLSIYKEILERSPIKIDTILSFNHCTLLDSSLLDQLAYFQEKGVAVINASVFAAGLLVEGRTLPSWHSARLPAYAPLVEASKQALAYCKERGVNISKLALRHAFNRTKSHNIAITLVGISSVEILETDLQCLLSEPSEVERNTYKEVMEKFMHPLEIRNWEADYANQYKNIHPGVKCWWLP